MALKLAPFRDQIAAWRDQNISQADIMRRLSSKHGVKVSRPTLAAFIAQLEVDTHLASDGDGASDGLPDEGPPSSRPSQERYTQEIADLTRQVGELQSTVSTQEEELVNQRDAIARQSRRLRALSTTIKKRSVEAEGRTSLGDEQTIWEEFLAERAPKHSES